MQHGACRALTCSSTSILRSAALSRTAYIDAPRGRCLIQLLMLISLVPTASRAIALPTRPVATAKAKRPHRDDHPLSPHCCCLPHHSPHHLPLSATGLLHTAPSLSCTHPRTLPSVAPVCTNWPCCLPKGPHRDHHPALPPLLQPPSPPPGHHLLLLTSSSPHSCTLRATRLRGVFICSPVIRACELRARRSGGAARRPRA